MFKIGDKVIVKEDFALPLMGPRLRFDKISYGKIAEVSDNSNTVCVKYDHYIGEFWIWKRNVLRIVTICAGIF